MVNNCRVSEYTPTTEDVRGAYRAWHDGQGDDHALKPTWSAQERSHPDDWGVPCVYVKSYAERLRGEKR